MIMRPSCLRPFLSAWLAVFAALLFVACGGGNGAVGVGGGISDSGGTGAASIFLTDAPNEYGFDQILVTIEAIELIGSGGPITVFSGLEVVDLTDLENFSDLFVYAEQVPVGTYNKLRMKVTDIELVRGDEVIAVDPPANGRLDLLPGSPFQIRQGVTLVIEIDMDANKSIHLVRTGGSEVYAFRPVVKVTITETRSPDKLARVHGEIIEIFDDGSFEFCSTVFLASRLDYSADDRPDGGLGDRHRCMTVEVDPDTGVFDSNGDPADTMALMVSDEVTVVGRFYMVDDNRDEMMAGGGMGSGHNVRQRSFSDRMGRGQDSDRNTDSDKSTDSDKNSDSDLDSDDDSDSDSDGDRPSQSIVMLAYVIEMGPPGTFLQLAGIIESEVDPMDEFDFRIGPGQGFGNDSVVSALLQDGTRIFTRRGREVDDSEIIPDTQTRIDGIFSSSSEATLYKTALLVLDIDIDIVDVLRGTVLEADAALRRLLLDTVSSRECVNVPMDAEIFLVREGEGGSSSERGNFDDLVPGMRTDVYGMFEAAADCFVADTIIGFPSECRASDDCAEDQFCAKDVGACEQVGECQLSPQVCTLEFDPVCGCDGVTYSNECSASGAGASLDHEGECEVVGPPL